MKAKSAAVRAYGLGIGMLSVRAAINVWESIVRSVMEYGSEVWGDVAWEQGELIQREVGRKILRVNSFAPNEGVMGDLGWVPMKARRDKARIFQWIKILGWAPERLGKKIFIVSAENFSLKRTQNWAAGVHRTLVIYGLGDVGGSRGERVGRRG